MIKKILYKLDKQLRPKTRFFDGLEHKEKYEPHKKEIIEFIKTKTKAHNKQVLSGKAEGLQTFRNMTHFKKYNILADFFENEFKNHIDNLELHQLSRKLRAKAVHEKLKEKRFSDAFSYAKQHKIIESEIIKETFAEIDKSILRDEERVNKLMKTDKQKAQRIIKDLSLLLSFNRDYAKANNYPYITEQLKERYETLKVKYKDLV